MIPFDSAIQIVYEDNHIIVVNKYPSQLVQGDRTGDLSLIDQIKSYLKDKYNKPGNVFLGLVHRIDRPVSGLVIFARTSKALTRLNEMVKIREVKKTYWAVVKQQPPEDTGHLIHYLVKNQKLNKSFPVDSKRKGAKKAELSYTLIASSENYYLLEIDLLTGRHHQIRTQLAAIGCPIKGDVKYGYSRPNTDLSIHLHAHKIEFSHPVTNSVISLTGNPPYDKLWEYFLGKE